MNNSEYWQLCFDGNIRDRYRQILSIAIGVFSRLWLDV